MPPTLRAGVASFALSAVLNAVTLAWVSAWGVIGLYVWEPIWRDVFLSYTLDGGYVAGFAHALGLVGFLGGVVVASMLGLGLRRLVRNRERISLPS